MGNGRVTRAIPYEKDSNDDIATHVSKLQRIWQDLHEELKDVKESVPTSERNITSLVERLRLHEQRLREIANCNQGESSIALVVKLNQSKVGHFKKDCLKNKVNQTKNDKQFGQAFISMKGAGNSKDCCYTKFSEPRTLKLEDGRVMYAEGQINIEMLVHGKWKPSHLTNVWYVPEGDQNLLSAGSALDKDLVEYANNAQPEERI
ncbi:hypothetical protein Trydic_g3000 [Trypoxylus dichotomus]